MPTQFLKDPGATLDYEVIWTDWLGTDTIATSTWTVPAELTQPVAATNTTTAAKVWLAGGTDGTDYTVTNRITTAAGRVEERSLRISVRQR